MRQLQNKAADQFAATPSLHVVWALWVAVALGPLLRHHPVLRAAARLYPAATIADVLATANHYLLDVITAPGVLLLAYAVAAAPALARRPGVPRLQPWLAHRSAGRLSQVTERRRAGRDHAA
jgi:hypothetical protein